MSVLQLPSQHEPIVVLFLLAATTLLGYLAYTQHHLEQTRRAFKLRHGCQAATSKQTGRGLFGLRDIYALIKARNEHRLLHFYHQRHEELGSTYVTGNRKLVVYTNDPENMKCALATRFEDWCVPKWAFAASSSI